MAWMTLAEALESALASGLTGYGAVGAAPDDLKMAGAVECPGQVVPTEGTTQPAEAASPANGRGIDTANPSRAPQRGVVSRPMLLLIKGGLAEAGGDTSARPIAPRGNRGEPARKLVVIVGGHQWTASA